jgi:hypothetical protein
MNILLNYGCASLTAHVQISLASFDLRVAREVHLNERVSAEVSADFFNLFNRPNVTDLNTVYGGTNLSSESNSGIRHASRRL